MADRLDDVDRRILLALEADGRASHAAIARRVNLSRSAVQERIARMERDGTIAGYTVRRGAAAEPARALRALVFLTGKAPRLDRVVAWLRDRPEVASCSLVSGEIDMVLEARVASTEELAALRDALAALPEVASTRTLLVMANCFSR
jgi:Lrp/AsnC family transcriptional regulator, leucine-responsive regulatory protein